MYHSQHVQNLQKQLQKNFQPIRYHQGSNNSQSMITLQDNPDFGLTFGRPETQLINQIFDTPPTQIHNKKLSSHNHLNYDLQPSFPLCNRINSTLHNNLPLKQLDLQKFRQNMSRITYSIKTIQSKNQQEIGITSRRVIMGNKLLQNTKKSNIKFNINSSRCTYKSNQIQPIDLPQTEESQFLTQKTHRSNSIIPHNKFHSKRLNVIVKRKKSNFPKQLQKSSGSPKNFAFDLNNQQNCEKQHSNKAMKSDCDFKTIEAINKITFRHKQNRPATIENKRLRYETLIAKKSSQKFLTNEDKFITNLQGKITFGEKLMLPHQGNLMSERKRKVSLSNILSQYHTQIIENSNNVLIERSNFCQPLKELFKNKFSTISKTVHEEGKNMLEKNLIKIKMRKHSVSKRELDNEASQRQQNKAVRQFRKYEEIQKENACLID